MNVPVSLIFTVPVPETEIDKIKLAQKALDHWGLFATGMAQSRKEPTEPRPIGHFDTERGGRK